MSVPTNLIPTKITGLPEYTGSSTLGYFPYSLEGRMYKVQFANLAAVGAVPSTRVVAAGTGLTGGGDLSENRVIAIANGGVGFSQLANSGVSAGSYGSGSAIPVLTIDEKGRVTSATSVSLSISGYVPDSRRVDTDASLTGGGPLSSNLTLGVNYYASSPQALGSASAGVSTAAARGDHVHPAVDLSDATQTQGALPLGRGGTGDALSPVAGAVVYSTGTKFALADPGLPGQVLTSAGTGEPYWTTVTGTGTVTSVAASGGVTGMTFSGSPITAAGTLVLGGTLNVASGGTGATTAADARTNLGAAASGANGDITSLSGVTGAISTPDYIDFDTAATVTRATGRLWWDSADGNQTLSLGMAGSNATLQIGEEMYFRIKASAAITEGQVVMFTGTVGASGALTGAPASGLTKDTASYVMGVATEDIALNGWGYVTQFGLVRGIDTTGGAEAWVDGQILYYDPAVPGGLTKTVPTAPAAKVEVAAVVNAASNGSLFVRPIARFSLGQLNDVETAAATNLDLLQYNSSGGYWQHVAPSTISVGTAANLAGGAANQIAYQTGAGATSFITAPTIANTFLEWSGSAFQWSSNPLGTVTSVAMTVPTGLTVSGSPITTSGTLAVSLQSGYSIPTTASQANWDTAYSERLQWDGGSTNLVAATGRTSLGATTVGSNFFTLTNPSAITFPRINADNTVNALSASDFRTAIGAGTGNGSVTSVDVSGGTTGLTFSGGPVTASGTITMAGTLAVGNGGTGATSLTSGYLIKGNGTSAVSSSIIYDSGTNVGIGTSSPSSYGKLTVSGNIVFGAPGGRNTAFTNNIGIWTTGDPLDDTRANIGFTAVAGASSSSSYITFTTNNYGVSGGERMRIDQSGNVGIGDTAPAYKLTVAGDTRLTGGGDLRLSSATGTTTAGGDSQIYNDANNMIFTTGTTTAERMRIDSSGNLGVGTSTVDARLNVKGGTTWLQNFSGSVSSPTETQDWPIPALNVTSYGDFTLQTMMTFTLPNDGNYFTGDSVWNFRLDQTASSTTSSGVNGMRFMGPGYLMFGPGTTEKARITSDGYLLVGTTAPLGGNTASEYKTTVAGSWPLTLNANDRGLLIRNSSASSGFYAYFEYNGGTNNGSISWSGGVTSYNITSDARIKDNIVDAPDAGDLIDGIKVRSWDFKADGAHWRYGMVAQELREVAPEAVTVPEDPELMMGVDYAKLVPMLVKEVQSLRARVAQLEGK